MYCCRTKMTSTNLSSTSFLCQESDEYNQEEDGLDEDYLFNADDDYVEMLIERETSLGYGQSASFECGNWIKGARLDAITWILQTRERFGFRLTTAYLSITYIDAFLCRRAIDNEELWAIRLLSAACLSLAAKMEECNIPLLTEFHQEHCRFRSEDIQRMELLVLDTLEWKIRFVTPFTFLQFFMAEFRGESPPHDIITRINELLFKMVKVVNLMKKPPSVIAAAATLAAFDQRLTIRSMELKIKFISRYSSLKVEDIFTSYNMMLRLNKEKTKLFDSPNPTLLDALEDSSAASDISTERERIAFNDRKQLRERKRLCNRKF